MVGKVEEEEDRGVRMKRIKSDNTTTTALAIYNINGDNDDK